MNEQTKKVTDGVRNGRPLRRALPLVFLLLVLLAFFLFGGPDYLSLEEVREHREELIRLVDDHMAIAMLFFVLSYVVAVAASLPGALVLTLVGGFLFGALAGGICTVLGATTGAMVIFLAAKTALGDPLRARAGPLLQRMEKGFSENAFSYLLFLRLMPVFPFVMVNLVPAFLGVRLSTFVLATFFGIMPATFVYASIGYGMGQVFDKGGAPDLSVVFHPEIFLPILGLAGLSLLPVLHKIWKKRRSKVEF